MWIKRKRNRKGNKKPFRFLFTIFIFYVWNENRIDVACRFDSVFCVWVWVCVFACVCLLVCEVLIGKRENHMWNKYISVLYTQANQMHIAKKASQWILHLVDGIHMSLTAHIKPSENRFKSEFGFNFCCCCSCSSSCLILEWRGNSSILSCDGAKCRCWFLAHCVHCI